MSRVTGRQRAGDGTRKRNLLHTASLSAKHDACAKNVCSGAYRTLHESETRRLLALMSTI